ncbi:MAG: response regulator transcription factor [Urechidicola sp.]|nr:response regulator transcription factor [Urechidicola sp.]
MKKTIVSFSLLVIAFIILFQISKYSVLFGNWSIELVTTIVAVIFLVVGIYVNKKSLHKPKPTQIDLKKIEALEISKREYEVLKEISNGLSNKEIAEKLFVSESTIKTHVSNLLLKLNAKRRTQAIQIAKEIYIID